MQVKLKYPRVIDGKKYAPGVHFFSEKMMDHWYVQALLKEGSLEMVKEKPKAPAMEPPKADPSPSKKDKPKQ